MTESSTLLKEVKPTDARRLPERFDLAHAVAFFFHDQLAELVVDLEAIGALWVHVDLKEGQTNEIVDLEGEELWTWLHENDQQDVIDDLTYRQLTAAVISDASHFLCEALLASGKGKTQVAYALLRKPLKENLLLLEWLACAPEEFLDRFHGESIRPYVLNRLPSEKRRGIIRKAAALVALPGLDAEFQWTVRYAKKYPSSLETLWTKAIHLVTSVDESATEPGNLNFVFSTASAIEEQWDHFYRTVPVLLYYFVAIAEQVASRFVEWDADLRPIQHIMRDLAIMRHAQVYVTDSDAGQSSDHFFDDLAEIGFECECGDAVSVGASGIDRFWLKAEIICPNCARTCSVWDLLGKDAPEADDA